MRLSLFFLSLAFVFLPSCKTSQKKPHLFEGIAMTIPYRIQIATPLTAQEKTELEIAISDVFQAVHLLYDNWNPSSEVSSLNQLAASETILLSEPLTTFLKKLEEMVHFSEGRFDPTLNKKSLPAAMGWENVHLVGNRFWKERTNTEIDGGGAAKGYAVDLLIKKLTQMGYKNVYVEWGGEIRTVGSHLDGRPWKIAILGLSETIELSDKAIATSGNYLQNWKEGGKIYTHIIDAKVKTPLEVRADSIMSVSVIADSCFEADAIATALMTFSSREEALLWAKKKHLRIWIIDNASWRGPSPAFSLSR